MLIKEFIHSFKHLIDSELEKNVQCEKKWEEEIESHNVIIFCANINLALRGSSVTLRLNITAFV